MGEVKETRQLPVASGTNDAMKEVFHLYDVVREDVDMEPDSLEPTEEELRGLPQHYRDILCNGLPMLRALSLKEDEYVYDVYYRTGQKGEDAQGLQDAAFMQVDALPEEDLVFAHSDSEAEGDVYGEDEDSNEEDHWKNDYPDEEEGGRFSDDDGAGAWRVERNGDDDEEDQLSDDDPRLERYYGFEEEEDDEYDFYEGEDE